MENQYKELPLPMWERVFRVLGGGFCALICSIFFVGPVAIFVEEGATSDFFGFAIGGLVVAFVMYLFIKYAYSGIKGFRKELIKQEPVPVDPDAVDTPLSKWGEFLVFLFLGVYATYLVFLGDGFKKEWVLWLIACSIPVWCAFSVFSLLSIIKGWTNREVESKGNKAFRYAIATPFALAGIALVLSHLMALFGWFSSIPSWATVMIILMVLILIAVSSQKRS